MTDIKTRDGTGSEDGVAMRLEAALERFEGMGLSRVLAGRQGPGIRLDDLRSLLRERYALQARLDEAEVAKADLVEALKGAVEDLQQTLRWRGEGWECLEDELLGRYRAAISKATGAQ